MSGHASACRPVVRRALAGLGTTVAMAGVLAGLSATAYGVTLPDNRAYELVTSIPGEGGEGSVGESYFLASSESGDTVDWDALGACCGASTGGINTYQADRGPSGWQSHSITPTPSKPLSGFEELQEVVFTTRDLSQAIFITPESYAAGDRRTPASGGDDLYLQGPTGALKWLSQGPLGSGEGPYPTRFDGATANAGEVLFSTAEPLTSNASGLSSHTWAQYLYARNPESETTSLIDVDNSGKLISPYGATLGDAGPPKEGIISSAYRGTTTNSISEDGSKIFFETPVDGVEGLPEGVEPHLYMRDLADDTTTALDDPTVSGAAHFEGAAADGSLVFFTSTEGLDGASKANELYEFNTTTRQIGPAPPMASVPVANGAGITGVTAVSNDGSRVFFVARDVLAGNTNSAGRAAVANAPNLYVYDTSSGETQFVATLAPTDVSECKPTCAATQATGLVQPAAVYRPAYPTPKGSELVFTSSEDLTGEDHKPSTTLTSGVGAGEHRLEVASTAGFIVGHTIAIGSGEQEELQMIEAIDSPTELTISEYGPAIVDGLVNEHEAGTSVTALNAEVYLYKISDGSLTCLSCTPAGVLSTDSASLGEIGGGSYAPAGYAPQMSEDGSRIFFDSPDPLLPGMAEAVTDKVFEPTNVYEWEDGTLHLIADAASDGAVFYGTTPSDDDVFFTSRSQLAPGASAGYEHIYDARVDGGFPQEAQAAGPCLGEVCRPLGASSMSFPEPSSEGVSEPGASGHEGVPPSFTVAKITAAQRAKLARSGCLRLTVDATVRSGVTAVATAKLHGKQTRVARASAALHGAGKITLTLRLSRAARAQLAERGTLLLRVAVTYKTTGEVDVTQLRLHAAGQTQAAERKAASHA